MCARVADLGGATVCVAQGTTHELNLADTFRARRLQFTPVVFERVDQMYARLLRRPLRCDDAGCFRAGRRDDGGRLNPALYQVLEETISKEPLGPFVRNGG